MVSSFLERFDNDEEKVSETLFNVYPDEMGAIISLFNRFVTRRKMEEYLNATQPHKQDPEAGGAKGK